MKKKKEATISSRKEELQKQLKRKSSALKRLKRELEINAEQQAREARIEAALERVRSRTMAMQRSEELVDAADLMFQQIEGLGVTSWNCGFNIWDEDKKYATSWNGTKGGLSQPFRTPSSEDVFFRFYEAAQRGETLYVEEIGGEACEAHYRYMATLPLVGDLLKGMAAAGVALPTFQIFHIAYFLQGYLMFITYEPVPQLWDIFKRFAKVFEQTYTRFLDLQKAEAQAREAKIEAALEKVRSRSLAMHKSHELQEVVNTVYDRLTELDIEMASANIAIFKEGTRDFDYWVASPFQKRTSSFHMPYIDLSLSRDLIAARESGTDFSAKAYSFEEKNEWFNYVFRNTDFKFLTEERKQFILDAPAIIVSIAFSKYTGLQVIRYSTKLLSEREIEILKRFSKVFEQAYTRFLDLQKAEAQARESQIQLAMERVRARTMAMQNSNELPEAANLLFQQVQALGMPAWSAGYCIWDEDKKAITLWMSSEGVLQPPFRAPLTEDPSFIHFREAHERGETFFVDEIGGEELVNHYKYMRALPVVGEILDSIIEAGHPLPTFQIFHLAYFSQGFLLFITYEPAPEAHDIFKRFAKVFEQTYTRFLDLQKAEAQAREAQIQLSLERVRARAMSMRRSEELFDLLTVLIDQFDVLGIRPEYAHLSIIDSTTNSFTFRISGSARRRVLAEQVIDINASPIWKGAFDNWKTGEYYAVSSHRFPKEILPETWKLFTDILAKLPEEFRVKIDDFPNGLYLTEASCKYGFLGYGHSRESTQEEKDIIVRFVTEFERSYQRFLDLQKAEAQAREAQIETALERVRSRTMAMQHSDELPETAAVLFGEFKKLGEDDLIQATIGVYHEAEGIMEFHSTSWAGGGEQVSRPFNLSIEEPTVLKPMFTAWKAKEKSCILDLTGEALDGWINYRNKMTGVTVSPGDTAGRRVIGAAFFSKGHLSIGSPKLFSPETINTLERFAGVFDGTYTRFLDLQKAEAQARESQIEAALERVRSRSMGMQKSDELRDVIKVIFEQLIQLNFEISNAGFLMDCRESDDYNLWMADAYTEYPTKQHVPYFDHLFNNDYVESKEKGLELFAKIYSFEEKNTWLEQVVKYLPGMSAETKEALLGTPALAVSRVLMKNIALYLSNYAGTPYSEAENATLIRFTKVFEQTYIRFNDLKQAEAQALEAIKRASVDRVRAEIASMRTTNDLERITPLIWNELTMLGVPFIRCGVFIMDEEQQQVQSFLSTPDGKAIAAFRQPYNTPGEIAQIIEHWHKKKMYKQHWNETQFIEFTKTLVQQGAITSGGKYLTENRPTDLYLHFLPFLQGMLYAGSTTALGDDELQLVQNLADTFSTAYARYEDFNKLESANVKIEKTLVDLKQTQAQLVQSEKMASLGELTAGIAHEIQNPLNFVNNFSELNKELLGELNEEIEKGNYEEVKIIAKDLTGNEEKISHHGKRADAIVKGMLQHSRNSSATKEPTDINKLADEYLRLAYHGLRAKDNSFNAMMKTDYDESLSADEAGIGNIKIIPQDIGRVLLNLYNNAFYAVKLPNPLKGENYEPTVTVSTKLLKPPPTGGGLGVLISVKDNGNGIPQKVVDKIFQPFFTTKPTGQGTGLGLSLAYDIIKAHGGEIKVETKEGEGSEFIIQLPIK